MGTDIHTAVEVRRDGKWSFVGRIFESRWDFSYEPVHVLASIDDDALLEALNWEATPSEDSQYGGKLVPLLSESIVEKFRVHDLRRDVDREIVKAKADEIRERPEGWDYSLVEEVERKLSGERKADFADFFTEEERKELVRVATKFYVDRNARWAEEDGDDDPEPIRLSRRGGDEPFRTHEVFDVRNYDLFAALANVRNGRGFAGVLTGKAIKPIAAPRGVPDDADPETVKKLSNEHTPSWLTLAELNAYDWDQGKTSYGVISGAYYDFMRQHKEDLYPWDDECERQAKIAKVDTGVSGSISGQGIVTLSPEGYEAWKIAPRNQRAGERVYVQISWKRSLRDGIAEQVFDDLKAMEQLVPDGGSQDDVRVVFDFDS